LVLATRGTLDDLSRLKITLTEGMEATFYSDDADEHGNSDPIEVDGRVHLLTKTNDG